VYRALSTPSSEFSCMITAALLEYRAYPDNPGSGPKSLPEWQAERPGHLQQLVRCYQGFFLRAGFLAAFFCRLGCVASRSVSPVTSGYTSSAGDRPTFPLLNGVALGRWGPGCRYARRPVMAPNVRRSGLFGCALPFSYRSLKNSYASLLPSF
jgi:hypothetical protein